MGALSIYFVYDYTDDYTDDTDYTDSTDFQSTKRCRGVNHTHPPGVYTRLL